jgi:hypothetical protein
MDGKEEVIAFSEGKLKLFKPDSTFSTLTYIENLSCGGKLVTADSMSFSLIGSTRGYPVLRSATVIIFWFIPLIFREMLPSMVK